MQTIQTLVRTNATVNAYVTRRIGDYIDVREVRAVRSKMYVERDAGAWALMSAKCTEARAAVQSFVSFMFCTSESESDRAGQEFSPGHCSATSQPP
jgi:hypothetical protein